MSATLGSQSAANRLESEFPRKFEERLQKGIKDELNEKFEDRLKQCRLVRPLALPCRLTTGG